jgi:hypothetical protein
VGGGDKRGGRGWGKVGELSGGAGGGWGGTANQKVASWLALIHQNEA